MKKLSVILFVLWGLQSFSQVADTGYVITNSQDTLWGSFKEDMLSKKVKIYINGELKKFDVTELLGYKKGNEINKRFSNDYYMATLEKAGKINLWVIDVRGEHGFVQYFLEKDGVSCQLTKKTWKTTIADWLKDYSCDSELLKNELRINKLEKIIEEYNSCK
jgi:hypothetical protein